MTTNRTQLSSTRISDRRLVVGFAVAVTVLISSFFLTVLNARTVLRDVTIVDHSQNVLQCIAETSGDIFKLESAARGFILRNQQSSLYEFNEAKQALHASIESLGYLTRDNRDQQLRISQATALVNQRIRDLDEGVELRRRKGLGAALNNPRSDQALTTRARLFSVLLQIRTREQVLMTNRSDQANSSVQLAVMGLWASGAIALAALTGFFLLANRLFLTLRELRLAEENRAMDLEERVRERTFELSAAIRDLEAFSYSVSHDLRAPLRAMSGYAGILRKDLGSRLEVGDVRLLERMQANCVKMSDLIDALLALFRVAKKELMLEQVDLSDLAREALDDVLTDYPQSTAKTTIQSGMTVFADRSMMRVLMVNLIGNAVKFSSKTSSPMVYVGVKPTETGSQFYVRDNGAGFEQSQSGLLFEPFQRLHTEQEFAGTGVGLAMCRKIIVRHRGEIWLESVPDVGTSVFFTVGLRAGRDDSPEVPQRARVL